MPEIGFPTSDAAKEMEALLVKVRAGVEAQTALAGFCGSDPRVAAALKEGGVLKADPEDLTPLQEALANWLVTIDEEEARFKSMKAFWKWFVGTVQTERLRLGKLDRAEQRAAIGQNTFGAAEASSMVGSSRILASTEMALFEPLFTPAKERKDDEWFVALCRVLFRLQMWSYMVRRRRNRGGSLRHVPFTPEKLAFLVDGFGIDADRQVSVGAKIRGWLKPSRANFKRFVDKDLIDRVRNERRTTEDEDDDDE